MKIIFKETILLAFLLVVFAGTYGVFAQGPGQGKQNDVRKAIEATEVRFSSLFASGDMKSLSELYTEDGEVMAPNASPLTGRPAIRDFWQGVRDSGVARVETKTLETSGTGGDATYETGTYMLYDRSGKVIDDGKYIVIWRREGKLWLLYRDIWNSNRK
jgi:ketosteroid isomerase-like protein